MNPQDTRFTDNPRWFYIQEKDIEQHPHLRDQLWPQAQNRPEFDSDQSRFWYVREDHPEFVQLQALWPDRSARTMVDRWDREIIPPAPLT